MRKEKAGSCMNFKKKQKKLWGNVNVIGKQTDKIKEIIKKNIQSNYQNHFPKTNK